jgi:uncharacterized protein (TIGR03435 family)
MDSRKFLRMFAGHGQNLFIILRNHLLQEFVRSLMFKKANIVAGAVLAVLSATALRAQTAPMAASADPFFEVATIRLHKSDGLNPRAGYSIVDIAGEHYSARNVSLEDLVKFAYRLPTRQVINLPSWADGNRYDISAVMQPEGRPNGDQLRIMLQKLLAERFKLTSHTEQRVLPAYALTVVKGGAKMPTSDGKISDDTEHAVPGGIEFLFRGVTVKIFANFLQQALVDRPVVDQTGLSATANYDFDLTFLPDESMFGGRYRASAENVANSAPNLFTALQEQLGLKLSPEKLSVDVLVIEHVEAPSAN